MAAALRRLKYPGNILPSRGSRMSTSIDPMSSMPTYRCDHCYDKGLPVVVVAEEERVQRLHRHPCIVRAPMTYHACDNSVSSGRVMPAISRWQGAVYL